MKKLILLLTIIISLSLCYAKNSNNDFEQLNDYLKEEHMLTKSKIDTIESIVYAKIKNDGKESFLVISKNDNEEDGYNGKTKVAIFFTKNAQVTAVKIIDSEDTRRFVKKVKHSTFLDQFVNWNGKDTIKARSGATFTSDAIQLTVKNNLPLINKICYSINN